MDACRTLGIEGSQKRLGSCAPPQADTQAGGHHCLESKFAQVLVGDWGLCEAKLPWALSLVPSLPLAPPRRALARPAPCSPRSPLGVSLVFRQRFVSVSAVSAAA